MKKCSVRGCSEIHDSIYKMCDTCRMINRNNNRKTRNSRIHRVLEICEKNKDLNVCKEILKIINEDARRE